MTKELTLDLASPRFVEDKYGYIEELRQQSWYGRTERGVVLFNQQDAQHVMRCVDFRFSFFQINPEVSAYLAESVKHELEAFAHPIPSRVLGPMLGIPYEDVEGVDEWIKIGGRKVDALRSGDGIEQPAPIRHHAQTSTSFQLWLRTTLLHWRTTSPYGNDHRPANPLYAHSLMATG